MGKDISQQLEFSTAPKNFRIWDTLHHRWFQGGTSESQLQHMTDNIDFFGETITMSGTLHDQNEDSAWRESIADGKLQHSVEIPNFLIVVQDTGLKDKTGRHVFEGDILSVNDPILGEYRSYIIYDRERGRFAQRMFGDNDSIRCLNFEYATIIGNIFETGELFQ